jgi:branched-chain amino acid transport system substrate-binding protein
MQENTIRIGLCTDLSGPYESVDGNAGAEAVRMAIEVMNGTVAGRQVELVLGDHRNDEREAAAIAQRWFADEGVDMVVSGVNSNTSLAMTAVAAQLGKPILVVGAALRFKRESDQRRRSFNTPTARWLWRPCRGWY